MSFDNRDALIEIRNLWQNPTINKFRDLRDDSVLGSLNGRLQFIAHFFFNISKYPLQDDDVLFVEHKQSIYKLNWELGSLSILNCRTTTVNA